MPEFNRFDIAEAYYLFGAHYNMSGLCMHPVSGREINWRVGRVLRHPRPNLAEETLTENGKAIYAELERLEREGSKTPVPAWVHHHRKLHGLPPLSADLAERVPEVDSDPSLA